ncbi:putative transcriptional repressor with DNA-binding Winged helix domain [Vibrio sp. N418]|uniref:GntR family transcriptional regulator n=1 Tax=Vibrio sp. (strain N418) TaxID=701176 RepID=UPI00021BDED3|nr:GntR family transcriptional regulator [Vibrio sp. N418]EGU36533.1 putative transcriptional repressor with DNA-binding Winged helix domain [Vibrio sp. N418]
MTSQNIITAINENLSDNSLAPKYIQLKESFELIIKKRIIANGAVLPSERKLAEELNVSRVTIVKVLEELRLSGLIIKKQGKGTTVNFPLDYNLSGGGFSSQLHNQGQLSNRWISRELIEGEEHIRQELNVIQPSKIAKVKRVRLTDDTPVSIETMFIPQVYLPRPELLEWSLYQYWSEQGIKPSTQEYQINAHQLTQEEADMLETEMSEPALMIILKSLDHQGNILEYGSAICRSASYNFKFKVQLLD